MTYDPQSDFSRRHNGTKDKDRKDLLKVVNTEHIDQLINDTIPAGIRLNTPLEIGDAQTESECLAQLRKHAQKNIVNRSYIGYGYHPCITPSVIQRHILENPNWYTAYTPYQPEISQGRLEALINFQTLCIDLTGMDIANASLLDEGTAAAEAMTCLYRIRSKEKVKNNANTFYISSSCFEQTIDIVKTRSEPLGINLVISDPSTWNFSTEESAKDVFGLLLQYPDKTGEVCDYSKLTEAAHKGDIKVAVASDLFSLIHLKPPGEWNADVVVGSTQRFGIPMGYGGPHAAYFATKKDYQRQVPGRLIGVTKDKFNKKSYRMALQTREQHIRRDKATSNICTSQVLLANMAGFYAVFHGPEGLKHIASRIHHFATRLSSELKQLGYSQLNKDYFDTLTLSVTDDIKRRIQSDAEEKGINFFYSENGVTFSVHECSNEKDSDDIISIFKKAQKNSIYAALPNQHYESTLSPSLIRTSPFLTQDVFNRYHTETAIMRYMKQLENKDLTLCDSMIPLGSCTMKLNAATQMIPLSWEGFSSIHPFSPTDQTKGYDYVIKELSKDLCTITGFDGISMQPNSGAQGEYAGLLVIRAYLKEKGEGHRDKVLIPVSAHGTNFATTTLAGMTVILVKCDDQGNVDMTDLKEKAEKHEKDLAAIMITYPSTHGVFEEGIREICDIVHRHGGQVYMDGANLNAQVGLTSPGHIGADVCHLNLHKTFSIPHGGGGPGMGPITVKEHLIPFLPTHPFVKNNYKTEIPAISSAHYGSASILLISYAYIKLLGSQGLREASEGAILNANYIKERLQDHYPVLFTGPKGRVAHELIIDARGFKKPSAIEAEDIAKRLMDYGFHSPTLSWPVAGTLMIEPTESENKEELDRFCDAMISIRDEIQAIIDEKADRKDNVLKQAPHTEAEATSDDWSHPYSRQEAVYPLPYVKANKFWPSIARVDQAYGDRNLVCSCSSEDFIAEAATQ